jgi:hypothetical protein
MKKDQFIYNTDNNLHKNMEEYIKQLESKTITATVSILYEQKSDNMQNPISKNFIEYLKKNKKCVETDPQIVRYEYIVIGHPYDIDLIIINKPTITDMHNHLSLEALDRIKKLKVPVLIVTDTIQQSILNGTDPVLLFHKINILK